MLVGVVNGLFVTKGKIHAFIVTLGMLTTVKGLLYMITGSASINIKNFQIVSFMESKVLWLFTPEGAHHPGPDPPGGAGAGAGPGPDGCFS